MLATHFSSLPWSYSSHRPPFLGEAWLTLAFPSDSQHADANGEYFAKVFMIFNVARFHDRIQYSILDTS